MWDDGGSIDDGTPVDQIEKEKAFENQTQDSQEPNLAPPHPLVVETLDNKLTDQAQEKDRDGGDDELSRDAITSGDDWSDIVILILIFEIDSDRRRWRGRGWGRARALISLRWV
jgi:hypothetical protein